MNRHAVNVMTLALLAGSCGGCVAAFGGPTTTLSASPAPLVASVRYDTGPPAQVEFTASGPIQDLAAVPGRNAVVVGAGSSLELWALNPEGTATELIATEELGAPVDSVAVSPEGERVAATSRLGGVQLWPLELTEDRRGFGAGVAIRPPVSDGGYPAPPTSSRVRYGPLDFSPDGAWLAAAWRGRLDFYRLRDELQETTTAPIRSLPMQGEISAITWSRAEQELMGVGTVDGIAAILRIELGETVAAQVVSRQSASRSALPVTDLAASHRSGLLTLAASAGAYHAVFGVSGGSGPTQGGAERIELSPDGALVFTALGSTVTVHQSDDSSSTHSGDPSHVALLEGHREHVRALDIMPSANLLVSGSADGQVRLWPLDPFASPDPRWVEGASSHFAHFSPDGRWLVTMPARVPEMRLWALRSDGLGNSDEHRVVSLGGTVESMAAALHSPVMVISYERGQGTSLWRLDWDAPGAQQVLELPHPGNVRDVAISADGSTVATSCEDHRVRLWSISYGEPPRADLLAALDYRAGGRERGVNSIALSSDGRWLLVGLFDETLRVVRISNEEGEAIARQVAVLQGPHDRTCQGVSAVDISRDGRWILGSWCGHTTVWSFDDSTGAAVGVRSLRADAGGDYARFSPYHDVIHVGEATFHYDDFASGTPEALSLATGRTSVHHVAHSPDGRLIAVSYHFVRQAPLLFRSADE